MSQRLANSTKWLWCLLVLYVGPISNPVKGVSVRNPPKTPTTVEAQAKFFQDFFSVQLSPYKIEFGHVCEDPNTWEQRYEKNDYKNHRAMGKVRWGDKKGGYGEHYWDLNHAGNAHNHGNDDYDSGSDDGSYHHNDSPQHDSYDEPSEPSANYENDDYDPEKSSYEENGRTKRAHPRNKPEKRYKEVQEDDDEQGEDSSQEEKPQPKPKKIRKVKEQIEEEEEEESDDQYEPEKTYTKPVKPKRGQHKHVQKEPKYEEEENNYQQPKEKEKNQVVLVVSENNKNEHNDAQQQPTQYVPRRQPEQTYYVPYEGGAGLRQHQQPEVSATVTAPRLFLEPTTGHVVDRATGQAYVLQPIIPNNNIYSN